MAADSQTTTAAAPLPASTPERQGEPVAAVSQSIAAAAVELAEEENAAVLTGLAATEPAKGDVVVAAVELAVGGTEEDDQPEVAMRAEESAAPMAAKDTEIPEPAAPEMVEPAPIKEIDVASVKVVEGLEPQDVLPQMQPAA